MYLFINHLLYKSKFGLFTEFVVGGGRLFEMNNEDTINIWDRSPLAIAPFDLYRYYYYYLFYRFSFSIIQSQMLFLTKDDDTT